MKRILFILGLLFSLSPLSAEVWKFTAYEFSCRYYDTYAYSWSSWSDWEDCNLLIVVDTYKERVTIYSSETQVFDIISTTGTRRDSNGNDISQFTCIDSRGLRCGMRVINCQNGTNQLYLDYSDFMYVYNIQSR